MIQVKMGPTEYGKAYNIIRTEVQERRQARKYKRSIQVCLHFIWNINSIIVTHTKFKIDGCGSGEGCEDEDQKTREDTGREKRKV